MAGLFSMPTPEAVRAEARQNLQQQSQLFAAVPRGRGGVLAASQAGGLLGEAIGRGMGGVLPQEEKARKFQEIQQNITQQINDEGIDISQPAGQIEMVSRTAKALGEFPEQQMQALVMLNQLRASLPKKSEVFGEFEKIPGTDYYGQRSSKTNKFANTITSAEYNRLKGGAKETAVVPSALERERKKVIDLSQDRPIQIGDENFSFDEINNQDAYVTWVADRAKEIQAQAKRKRKEIGFQRATAMAKKEADTGLATVPQGLGGFMTNLEFTPPVTGATGEDIISFGDL